MPQERELPSRINSGGKPQGALTIGGKHGGAGRGAVYDDAGSVTGILPVVRSMSSCQMEKGLETLTLDHGLGYYRSMARHSPRLRHRRRALFLVRKADWRTGPHADRPKSPGPKPSPLCLLTREWSTVIDAFAGSGPLSPQRSRPTHPDARAERGSGRRLQRAAGRADGRDAGYRELEVLGIGQP
jgi:hypothetical protein